MDDETLDSLATTTAAAPGMHPLLARLLRAPSRIWLRLASPAGLRLLAPIFAAVVVYLLWRLWAYAGRSVLGRMVRWWTAWVAGAVLLGLTVFLLVSPPETSADAVALRAMAEEEISKAAIYSVPFAAAGGVAVALASLGAAGALWIARVTPEERAQARRPWSSLMSRASRHPRVIRRATAIVYDAHMKFGTRTQVLKQPTEEVFNAAARLGFDGLEFDLGRDYKSDILWTAEGRKRLLEMAKQTGVEVSSVCLGALWGQTFAADEPDARDRAKEIVTEAARFTPELGPKVILVPIVGVENQTPSVGVERWIEGLRQVAPVAEQTGAVLALENVGRSPARSAPEMLNIIDAVGSPAVKAYYDVGNGTSFGFDANEELRLLKDHIAQVHIKGAKSAQLWENTLDMDKVAGTLKEIGYDGYLVFETSATEDPLEGAGRNLKLLKEHINKAYGA